MFAGPPRSWDDYAERVREQLPAAPEPLLDGYVKWAPWVALMFGALSLLFLLTLGVLGAVLTPFLILLGVEGIGTGLRGILSLILGVMVGLVAVAGGYHLLQRRLLGWWLVALGLTVSALTDLLTISLFGLVLTALIAYLHLHVKPRYR